MIDKLLSQRRWAYGQYSNVMKRVFTTDEHERIDLVHNYVLLVGTNLTKPYTFFFTR